MELGNVVFIVLSTSIIFNRGTRATDADVSSACERFGYEYDVLKRVVTLEVEQRAVDEMEREMWERIKTLKHEMKVKRQEVKELNDDLHRLRVDMNSGFTKLTSPVVFKVTKLPSKTTAASKVLLFDSVETNVGDTFSVEHGFFKAPEAGTYIFTVQVCCYPGTWVSYDIKVRGTAVGEIRTGDKSFYDCSMEIIAHTLNVADEVWVQHKGGNNVDKHWAMFDGVLIKVVNMTVWD
ncbi:hypothetical protein CHS0354_004117 [Potamilus streckersoni]|uniref:C1q domain-containing protein n=1 Tax=Potamilus streckersoni TaxID=2493646 RepID=A0AAE0VWP8_9BIVA|nr:hypothetical protein CHS0354_004117 [Potamilus streckersoni]